MGIFKAGGGLNPKRYENIIVHRAELDRILNHIENEELYIALRSPRQTGKTTLLYQIQAHLHGHGYGVAYLDLSNVGDLNKVEFYQTLCSSLHDGLNSLLDDNIEQLLNPKAITNQNSFSDYLKLLVEHTPQARKLILILDEVGEVPEKISATFFPTLRKFYHSGQGNLPDSDLYRKIIFIFAGALDLRKLMQGHNSPLRNICIPFPLTDLSRAC